MAERQSSIGAAGDRAAGAGQASSPEHKPRPCLCWELVPPGAGPGTAVMSPASEVSPVPPPAQVPPGGVIEKTSDGERETAGRFAPPQPFGPFGPAQTAGLCGGRCPDPANGTAASARAHRARIVAEAPAGCRRPGKSPVFLIIIAYSSPHINQTAKFHPKRRFVLRTGAYPPLGARQPMTARGGSTGPFAQRSLLPAGGSAGRIRVGMSTRQARADSAGRARFPAATAEDTVPSHSAVTTAACAAGTFAAAHTHSAPRISAKTKAIHFFTEHHTPFPRKAWRGLSAPRAPRCASIVCRGGPPYAVLFLR